MELNPVRANRLLDIPDLLVVLVELLLHRLSFDQVLLGAFVKDFDLDSMLMDLLAQGLVLVLKLLELMRVFLLGKLLFDFFDLLDQEDGLGVTLVDLESVRRVLLV